LETYLFTAARDDVFPSPAGSGLSCSAVVLSDLLVLSGRGDVGSFSALYDATCGRVHSLVLRQVGADRADGITQQVYVAVWHRAGRYVAAMGHPMAWIISLTGHVLADHRVGDSAGPEDAPACGQTPIVLGSRTVQWGSSVTRTQQDLLTLVYLGGYTVEQAARMVEMGERAARDETREGLDRLQLAGAGGNGAVNSG
jgi:DNA-directed RNA polymerase specialized sigma24 family protein